MFSSRTKLGLRLLHELEKEKATGVRLSTAELKRRMEVSVGMHEAGSVLHDMKDACLIGFEWSSSRAPRYFYTPDAEGATLYDLVMAVDGRFGLWTEYVGSLPYDLTAGLTRVADAEAAVDRKISLILKKIRLKDLLYTGEDDSARTQLEAGVETTTFPEASLRHIG